MDAYLHRRHCYRFLLMLAIISSVSSTPGVAHAQWEGVDTQRAGEEITAEDPQPPVEDYSIIQLHFGLGSATGIVGLSYTYTPVPFFQIETGAGLGVSGFQLSLMPKLSFGKSAHRFTPGVGLSLGVPVSDNTRYKTTALWLNLDAIGYEYVGQSHFVFSLVIGWVVGISGGQHDPCIFSSCDYTSVRGFHFPQIRIGVGGWF